MREFLPGVLTWTWFSEPHDYDFNASLVLHEEGNLSRRLAGHAHDREGSYALADLDALLFGDGVPIREGGRERLRELVTSFPPH